MSNYFLFLDIETTGLDPARDDVLEVAAALTDDKFNLLESYETLTTFAKPIHKWDPYCKKIHFENGLLHDMTTNAVVPLDSALDPVAAWLHALPPKSVTLAGRSIHFDLMFLNHRMFDEAAFSHRRFDVSTLRQLARLRGEPTPDASTDAHRAMADVLADIAYCREKLHA